MSKKQTSIRLDVDDLTLDELEMLEDHFDAPIETIMAGKKAPMLRFMFYLLALRDDPSATLDAGGSIRLGDIEAPVSADPNP